VEVAVEVAAKAAAAAAEMEAVAAAAVAAARDAAKVAISVVTVAEERNFNARATSLQFVYTDEISESKVANEAKSPASGVLNFAEDRAIGDLRFTTDQFPPGAHLRANVQIDKFTSSGSTTDARGKVCQVSTVAGEGWESGQLARFNVCVSVGGDHPKQLNRVVLLRVVKTDEDGRGVPIWDVISSDNFNLAQQAELLCYKSNAKEDPVTNDGLKVVPRVFIAFPATEQWKPVLTAVGATLESADGGSTDGGFVDGDAAADGSTTAAGGAANGGSAADSAAAAAAAADGGGGAAAADDDDDDNADADAADAD
jgi:hypothetical protein